MATLWKQPVPVQSVDDLPEGPQVTPADLSQLSPTGFYGALLGDVHAVGKYQLTPSPRSPTRWEV